MGVLQCLERWAEVLVKRRNFLLEVYETVALRGDMALMYHCSLLSGVSEIASRALLSRMFLCALVSARIQKKGVCC